MKEHDIPYGSVVLNMDGKTIGTFANYIPRHGEGSFTFGKNKLVLLWGTDGFQVWQGDVDERALAQYPRWFHVANGHMYRKQREDKIPYHTLYSKLMDTR